MTAMHRDPNARLILIQAALLALVSVDLKARAEVQPDGPLNNLVVADSAGDPARYYHLDIPRRQFNPGNPQAVTAVGRAITQLSSSTVALALAVTFTAGGKDRAREGYIAFTCADGAWHHAVLSVEPDGSINTARSWEPVRGSADQGFAAVREILDAAIAAGAVDPLVDEHAALLEIEGLGGRLLALSAPAQLSAC
jgi:hypothetical protein